MTSQQVRWNGGERLRAAVADWHGSDRGGAAFSSALQKRVTGDGSAVPGSSRAMIQRYFDGASEPSLEFLRHAAAVLGVRFEWLALGEGERTEAEERRARVGNLYDYWEGRRREEAEFMEQLLPGAANLQRRVALQRFADKLGYLGAEHSLWHHQQGKQAILSGAASFLLTADEGIRRAREVIGSSLAEEVENLAPSGEFQAAWYDSLLGGFHLLFCHLESPGEKSDPR